MSLLILYRQLFSDVLDSYSEYTHSQQTLLFWFGRVWFLMMPTRTCFMLSCFSVHVLTFPLTLRRYFSYFTHLSYIGITAWLWAAGVQSTAFAKSSESEEHPRYPLQSWPRALQFLHELLFSTIATFRELFFTTPPPSAANSLIGST